MNNGRLVHSWCTFCRKNYTISINLEYHSKSNFTYITLYFIRTNATNQLNTYGSIQIGSHFAKQN